MSKVLIECSQRMPKELWETTLKKGLGPLYEDLNIRWEMLKPTGAYQEARYKNITEFVGSPEEMKEKIGDAEILIVGVAPVSDDVMDADPNLRIVFCPRGGPVNVDVEGATQRGIMVVNAPGRNAEGVADQTIGLLICEARHLARGLRFRSCEADRRDLALDRRERVFDDEEECYLRKYIERACCR